MKAKAIFQNLLIFLSFSLASVFIAMGSALHPWSQALPALDTSVWLNSAVGMIEGEVIYVDLWDHKGPFLFFIHYLGLSLTPHSLDGLWFLECLFLLMSLYGLSMTASLISSSRLVRSIAPLLCLHLYYYFFEMGDIVEEWAIPLISFSLYFFLRYLKEGQMARWQIYLSGTLCALSFLLNGNLISVWVCYVPLITFILIQKKNWTDLKNCAFWFLAGLFTVFLTTALILSMQGAFGAFIEAYFSFNNDYIQGKTLLEYYYAIMNSIYTDKWFAYAQVFLFLYLLHQREWDWKVTGLLYSAVSLLLLNLSGRGYLHYSLQLTPCMIVPLAVLLECLRKYCRDRKEFLFLLGIVFICFTRFEVSGYLQKITPTFDYNADNYYAGGNPEYYFRVNEWLGHRWSDELIEKWVINDTW